MNLAILGNVQPHGRPNHKLAALKLCLLRLDLTNRQIANFPSLLRIPSESMYVLSSQS